MNKKPSNGMLDEKESIKLHKNTDAKKHEEEILNLSATISGS